MIWKGSETTWKLIQKIALELPVEYATDIPMQLEWIEIAKQYNLIISNTLSLSLSPLCMVDGTGRVKWIRWKEWAKQVGVAVLQPYPR